MDRERLFVELDLILAREDQCCGFGECTIDGVLLKVGMPGADERDRARDWDHDIGDIEAFDICHDLSIGRAAGAARTLPGFRAMRRPRRPTGPQRLKPCQGWKISAPSPASSSAAAGPGFP